MKYICNSCDEKCELNTKRRRPLTCPIFPGKHSNWIESDTEEW